MSMMQFENIIKSIIKSKGGSIAFKDFMQMCLYHPSYGYYSSSKNKISAEGDFITATSQTSLFARTFANQFASILSNIGQGCSIVEFGAGTGKFATDCMNELNSLSILPDKYLIIELSNDLRFKQQQFVKKNAPQLFERFVWLDELPKQKIKAIIFANEVLDAMPVDIFKVKNNKLVQQGVTFKNESFEFLNLEKNDSLFDHEVQKILADGVVFQNDYVSELNTWLRPWVKSLKDILEQGVIFLCDYGYHRDLYYMPERSMGTLACYHNHKVNFDPFKNIGLQDITAHVDFTAVAEAAVDNDFELEGYMSQGNFLKRSGIAKVFTEISQKLNKQNSFKYTNDMKDLLLNTKLAETFKVICFSFGFEANLNIFDNQDNIDYLL